MSASDVSHTLLSGTVTVDELIADGELPYRDRDRAQKFLARLGVPHIVVRRRKLYRREVIRRAIAEETASAA
jgi:hypothetical protein